MNKVGREVKGSSLFGLYNINLFMNLSVLPSTTLQPV